MKCVPWETLPCGREWEFASHSCHDTGDQKVPCRHSERKAGIEVCKFQFSVWLIWPWRKNWGLGIKETVQVFTFLTQVLPHHHYPVKTSVSTQVSHVTTFYKEQWWKQYLSTHTQFHRCYKVLGRKPGNVSQPHIFIEGPKCGRSAW